MTENINIKKKIKTVEKIYLNNQKRITGACYANLVLKEDCEDCASEILIEAYKRSNELNSAINYDEWILRITDTVIKRYKRCYKAKKDNERYIDERDQLFEAGDDTADITINKDRINNILNILSSEEKEIYELYYRKNYTVEKIAELLNMQYEKVKSKIRRIKEKASKADKKYYNEK